MPLFDPSAPDISTLAFGADTHSATNGDPSIFESLSNVITKGVPLTGLSVVNSFANTGIELGNWMTGDDTKLLNVRDELGDGEYADYYDKHQQGIEAAGLVAGSFIPGTLALKGYGAAISALKLAKDAGELTPTIARAVGLLPSIRKDEIIEGAINEINMGDKGYYASMNVDKLKAIAYGAGDAALQSLAFEAATAATMKASPLLDKDSLGDVTSNMFYGALVGGAVGGVLDTIFIRGAFNKALLFADKDSKLQELSKRLGIGGYLAGDRVAALVQSLDDIPTNSLSVLASKKLAGNRQTAILDAKKMLQTITPEDSGDVSNAFFDKLLDMKEAGNWDKETTYNYLARLSKIERATNAPAEDTPNGTIFYVNSVSKDDTLAGSITNVPEEFTPTTMAERQARMAVNPKDVDYQLGYRIKDGASEIKVARFSDNITAGDSTVSRYANKGEAFNDGMDIYVDKNMRVQVNPDAANIERVARPGESRPLSAREEIAYRSSGQLPPNSKSLYGASVNFNTIDGTVSESGIPVVGDFGKPKLVDKGLVYGDKFSAQSLLSTLDASSAPIEYNARTVWAAARGVLAGDNIAGNDIPMMEQLYKSIMSRAQGVSENVADKVGKSIDYHNALGIKIDGEELPKGVNAYLQILKNAKDEMIANTIKDNPKYGADIAAMKANVPKDYIAGGMKSIDPKDMIVDPEQWSRVNNVRLNYDIGNIYQNDGQLLRGMIDVNYRIDLIKKAAETASAQFFGKDWQNFVSALPSTTALIDGVGPKFLKFSNAAYGSLGQQMERMGRWMAKWQTERMSAISERLSPVTNAIRNDEVASAELGMFRNVRQRTGERYVFLPPQIAAKYSMAEADGSSNMAVIAKSVVRDKAGNITDWNQDYTPEGFVNSFHADVAKDFGVKDGNYTSYRLSPTVARFERANQEINDYRITARNNWLVAQGLSPRFEPGTLYAPPIDTGKYPHFALVRNIQGKGGADDSVAMVVAENAKDLEAKIGALRSDFEVYTKSDLKKYHEVQGDYEYDRNFSEGQVNNAIRRNGILNNVFPDTRAETIIRDYTDWHTRQELRLARDHVELANGQLFAELRAMGDRFTAAETSQTGFTSSLLGRTVPNPYNSYIKTALNVSEKDEYRLWADANEKAESFFSTAFRVAKDATTAANKGMISYEEASAMSERFGLGNPYSAATNALSAYTNIANKLPPARYLTKIVSTANSILGASIIKLDAWQQLIHAVSTPILTLAEANSAGNLLRVELPDGSGRSIPSASKVLFESIGEFFDSTIRAKYSPLYKQIGASRIPENEYFQAVEALTLPYGKLSESGLATKMSNMVQIGQKLMGTNLSEDFTSWIAANSARKIFEAAGYTGQQLSDNIVSFVNRVKGNIVSSQRPIAFQGPIGQAIGLFQTYQFNLYNQLFRYVENGEGKTVAMMAAMQNTLFGFSSLPGFQLLNTHIIGNSANNPDHKDLYTATYNMLDKKLGDWLLFGSLSNLPSLLTNGAVAGVGLYSRGDVNPRQVSLLPINPADYPAIAAGVRFAGSLMDTVGKIDKGGDTLSSLLIGLEHNGLSRPLQGIAQLINGYSTNAKGSLIASVPNPLLGDNTSGWSEFFSAGNYARLLGARPLDEAVAIDQQYRSTLYQAKNIARIEALGKGVKTTLYNNQAPDDEQLQKFQSEYAQAGGDQKSFGKKMIEWTTDANASVANKTYRSLRNPVMQQMQQVMGGIPLPDFRNNGSVANAMPLPGTE